MLMVLVVPTVMLVIILIPLYPLSITFTANQMSMLPLISQFYRLINPLFILYHLISHHRLFQITQVVCLLTHLKLNFHSMFPMFLGLNSKLLGHQSRLCKPHLTYIMLLIVLSNLVLTLIYHPKLLSVPTVLYWQLLIQLFKHLSGPIWRRRRLSQLLSLQQPHVLLDLP
jgi:hypothetical protein